MIAGNQDEKTPRTADRRDQIPTQGPGSAAGSLGDEATRKAFVDGAPIHDGKAVTPESDQEPDSGPHPNAPPEQAEQVETTTAPPAVATTPAAGDQGTGSAALAKREPLPFYPRNADEMWRYATFLARSDLLPRALRGKANDVFVVLMKGHDFGWKPMQSIAAINVIEGKAEIGAQAIVALILQSGQCKSWRLVKSDERSAIYVTQRVGHDEPTPFEYTIEEAAQMGLLDKGRDEQAKANNQWRRQPRTMLRRRCQTNLGRDVYPDIVMGLYDQGELTEMSEVSASLGLSVPQVAEAIEVGSTEQRTIAAPAEPSAIKRLIVDPLKERLATRVAANLAGLVRRCSVCEQPIDPRDNDPCIACRPPTAA